MKMLYNHSFLFWGISTYVKVFSQFKKYTLRERYAVADFDVLNKTLGYVIITIFLRECVANMIFQIYD